MEISEPRRIAGPVSLAGSNISWLAALGASKPT